MKENVKEATSKNTGRRQKDLKFGRKLQLNSEYASSMGFTMEKANQKEARQKSKDFIKITCCYCSL